MRKYKLAGIIDNKNITTEIEAQNMKLAIEKVFEKNGFTDMVQMKGKKRYGYCISVKELKENSKLNIFYFVHKRH